MGNKQKTRKAAAKRFKITGSGKVMHRGHGVRHKLANKSNKRIRRQAVPKEVTNKQKDKVKIMLNA